MKRFALVLAAAALGTGCTSSTPAPAQGSVNLYWDFDRTAPAQPGGFITYDPYPGGTISGRCPQSAVDFVTVDTPSVPQVTVTCVYLTVQGVGVDGVDSGVQPFRVRGWRHVTGGDAVVYDQTFNLNVPAAAAQSYTVHVTGVAALLDVFTYLAFGTPPGTLYPTCASATPASSIYPPNLDVEIRDAFGTLIDQGSAGCAGNLPAIVFSKLLDLDDYGVRVQGRRVEDNALVFDSCSTDLAHFATQTGGGGFAPTAFTNPVPTCP
ncbi:MAG TPA: hypothetical protein VIV57_00770 [Anaeromyxobacter sp.]